MSRSFAATSDKITQGTAALPTTGSMAVWYYPTYTISDNIEHCIFFINSGTSYFFLDKYSDNQFYAGWYTGGVEHRVILAAGATGLTPNQWNHLCVTWTNGGTTELWINGVSKGTTSGLVTWNTNTITRYLGADSVNHDCRGRLGQFAVWNVVISNADVAALAGTGTGNIIYAPWNIKPASLVDYLQLLGTTSPEPNSVSGGTAGTVTGTTQAADPTVEYVFDAASNSGYQVTTSSYSWSHTCTGSNRYLSVDVALLSTPGTTVSSITYNGVALSLIGAQSTVSGAGRIEQWGLIAPATGANTIAVTLSTAVISATCAVSRTGVHQTTPTEAFNSAQATNAGAADASVAVTPVALNAIPHAALATDDTSVTANQVSRNNVTFGLGAGTGADEDTGIATAAGAVTMSYTGVGAGATWAMAGYMVRPTSASGSVFPGEDDSLTYQRVYWW